MYTYNHYRKHIAAAWKPVSKAGKAFLKTAFRGAPSFGLCLEASARFVFFCYQLAFYTLMLGGSKLIQLLR